MAMVRRLEAQEQRNGKLDDLAAQIKALSPDDREAFAEKLRE